MAVYAFRTSNYAQRIYLTQTDPTTLTTIPAEYVEPVKQYAADKYYIDDIDTALGWGKITQEEHDETLALKGPEDPTYRPMASMAEPDTTL
jgi:hypothetical protein